MSRYILPVILGLLLLSSSCGAASRESSPEKAPAVAPTAAQITFLELGSEQCAPCRAMKSVLAQIQARYAGKVAVLYHDVWTEEGESWGVRYGIRVIPTQIFLDAQGKEFFRHEGYLSAAAIEELLASRGVTP